MNGIDIGKALEKIANSIGLAVETDYTADGTWHWLEGQTDTLCKFADASRPVEIGNWHGSGWKYFSTREALLKSMLSKKYLHIPIRYKDYDAFVSGIETVSNPFYKLDVWEAVVKADLLST